MKNQSNHSTSIMGILRFILIGFLILSGLSGSTLYIASLFGEFMHFDSWFTSWIFAIILLGGMPLTLIIDGFVGSFYEKWGTPKTKQLFLFVAKVSEALLLVFIVHQADQWLKSVSCSIWSEAIVGYVLLLMIDAIFAIGKGIRKRTLKMEQAKMDFAKQLNKEEK